MKKTVLLFAMMLLGVAAMAQSNPLTKTPSQLAQEMTACIANDVSLTTQQQSQLTQVATTYFTTMRSETRSTMDARYASYHSYLQSMESIMTPATYATWREVVQSRIQQHLEVAQARESQPARSMNYICSGASVSGSNATVTLCAEDYNPYTVGDDPTSFNVVLPSNQYYLLSGWVSLENVAFLDFVSIREVDANGNTIATLGLYDCLSNNTTISLTSSSNTGRFVFDIYCFYGAINANSGFEFTIRPLTQTPMEQACASVMGVGTCSPQKTLHVNGELRVSCAQGYNAYLNVRPFSNSIYMESNSKVFNFNNKILSNNGFYSTANTNLTLGTGNNNRVTILNSNGNVGIGTIDPLQKLDVDGKVFLRTVDAEQGWANSYLYWAGHSLVMGTPPGAAAHNSLDLKPGGTTTISEPLFSRLRMYTATSTNVQTQKIELATEGNCWFVNNGNFGIGTFAPNYKLDVAGEIRSDSIRTQAINVQAVSGADYVFDEGYDLPTLEAVKTFIQANGHLPEIQSAEDMQSNGVNISNFQIQLLQKIEELTLYVIMQEERISELESLLKE